MKERKNTEKPSSIEMLKNVLFIHDLLFRSNKGLYLIHILLLVIDVVSGYVSMFILRFILNELTGEKNVKLLVSYTIGMAIAGLAFSLLKQLLSKSVDVHIVKTKRNIKIMLGDMVTNMPYADLEQPRVKDFIALAQNSDSFTDIISSTAVFFTSLAKIVTYGSLVLIAQPFILVLSLAVLIIEIWFDKLRRDNEYRWSVRQAPVTRKLNYFSSLLCTPEYGKEMRVNGLQEYFLNKKQDYTDHVYMQMVNKSVRMDNWLYAVVEVSKLLRKIAIYLLLGAKVIFDGMMIGDFSMFFAAADTLTGNLSAIVETYSRLLSCGMFAKEFKHCMKIVEKTKNFSGNGMIPERQNLSVEFRNVSFRYPNTKRDVLKNISFVLNPGEKLSLVGANGSGKTTMIKLLCRFYEPSEGEIFIGGANIKDLSPDGISKVLGIVFQDYKLFPFSVKENVAMNIRIDEDCVRQSLESSGLIGKIEKLRLGINTNIYKEFDENGIEFSGGEAQKLAISRVVYKDSPILILDEPTAALDPLAEYDILDRFRMISSGKTVIYISHRLSSVRFTDKIAVLSDGKLCEFGSHEELMCMKDGVYRNMFNSQASYYV